MRVCLAMIVRDEEAVLGRCLASALPLIDSYSILDTGSTDRTEEVIRETLRDRPGVVHHGEFVSFGATRSWLMRSCPKDADYLMLLDADMEVVYDGPLPELTADVYEGTIEQGSQRYALPILVRNDREWRYEGVAHSYLACDAGWDSEPLPGLRILDGSHTTVEKLRRDLELLRAEHARDPLGARTAFYLAQTYSDLDMIPEAIQAYRVRAHLDGWDEETYVARHRLGALLCEHVDFRQGARELLAAWEMRPHRAESLRTLSTVAGNVADKLPFPADRLFVNRSAYAHPEPPASPALPPFPPLEVGRRRRPRVTKRRGLDVRDVSAVVVTRGDVDLDPVIAPALAAGIEQVVVWDNSRTTHDYKAFGRYAAVPETRNPVIFWVDDDVVFTAFDELLAAYQPGRLVCNMDESWVEACGYRDLVGMQGAGSLCDADLPAKVWSRYLAEHPWDDDALTEADFVFGVLCPFEVVDLGYEALPYADDATRLYTQPWQPARKQAMIDRCRLLRDAEAVPTS